MSRLKYESVKIPILKKVDYSTWRVKMLMFLEAIDNSYVDIIKTGPPYSMKIVAMTADAPEHYAIKEKSKRSDPEKAAMLKDAKVRNIVHNSLDNVMSNKVISYKTTKEILDALETQCQGTMAIKKNRRAILMQEYDQLDVKTDDLISDIYNRFLILLNDLSLARKEYEREDSNIKFLIALPEDWDTHASRIRHQYDLDSLNLDEVYGMLKTHDLEIQQRKNRKGQKMKVVALNAETQKGKENMSERSRRMNILEESDIDDVSDPGTDTDKDSEIDMDDPQVVEMAEMLVKGFRRMRFTKPQRKGGFIRRFSGQGKDRFRKSDGQYTKERKFDKTKITCYNCNERGHLANECPKRTGNFFVTTNSNRDWTDSSGTDNDDECYALMATHGEDASGN
ncbi:uncharacterized protein LOC141690502 [Apium graveolens]|uniref:uncharacterized protein LOC141690502 n=1 Tax=Apium graveolens TaxID=4045 RepID=UPI003D79117E